MLYSGEISQYNYSRLIFATTAGFDFLIESKRGTDLLKT